MTGEFGEVIKINYVINRMQMYQKSLSVKTRLRHLYQYISPGVEEQPEEVVDSITRDLDSQEELQVHPITHVPPELGETHVSPQTTDAAHSSKVAPLMEKKNYPNKKAYKIHVHSTNLPSQKRRNDQLICSCYNRKALFEWLASCNCVVTQ